MVMVGTQIGNYRVVRVLGAGGMGTVYEAHHTVTGARAAIKVLLPGLTCQAEILARFLREGRAAALVSHPGIISIYDQGRLPGGEAYLVMEFLDGEPLSARVTRHGRLALPDALRIGRQIAATVAAAHARGIIHRDLKPDNLFLVADPEALGGERVKVLDFGIAKISHQGDAPEDHGRTRAGQILGTPYYMAPEQCREAAGVDDRADVYAMGVILYQLISGRLPFVAGNVATVLAMHISYAPPPLREIAREVPLALCALVHAMLQKDPKDRPPMATVAMRLEALAQGAPPSRRRLLLGVLGSSGALTSLLIGAWLQRRRALDPPLGLSPPGVVAAPPLVPRAAEPEPPAPTPAEPPKPASAAPAPPAPAPPAPPQPLPPPVVVTPRGKAPSKPPQGAGKRIPMPKVAESQDLDFKDAKHVDAKN